MWKWWNFKIEGILSKDIKNDLSFNIPLTFPEGITSDCKLNKKEAGKNSITCKVDRQITNSKIFIEQTIIKEGLEE